MTLHPTLVEKLLLFPWLVYREYPPGAGRSPIHFGVCGRRSRACDCGVITRAHAGSTASSPLAHLGRYPD